ncbi:MAG: PVC-type heme-binding CxxCH protein [Verrucomicrobiales bacterium]
MVFTFKRLILLLAAVLAVGDGWAARPLTVQKGDSIVIIGNTFAERMQLFGYFETFLHCRFPGHRLRVRNMGWSADEVDLRIRPKGFPALFGELEGHRADILFLCFGFNESFAGAAGVERYRSALVKLIRELQGQKFNGSSAPRIVVVSPLALEPIDGVTAGVPGHNGNLQLYSAASARAAGQTGVRFLDLYTPTAGWIAEHPDRRLTFNGIHLSEYGDWVVSQMMARGLELIGDADAPAAVARGGGAGALRRLVYEKNHHYFTWWHPPNASYIHGRRNRTRGAMHLGEERRQRRLLVVAADEQLWAVKKPDPASVWAGEPVAGRPVWFPTPKSRAIPGVVKEAQWEVASDGPADKHLRSAQEQLACFKVADGYRVNLFASEARFPIANPCAIHFDVEGRLWVANTPTWPHSLPGRQPVDSIVILRDGDGDGVADSHSVFLENMKLIHGFIPAADGAAYVAQVPNLLLARDTNGDGRADRVRTVLHGFGAEDAEHAMNNFRWGPGGSLYFSQGIFYNTQVETPHGPQRVRDAAVFRYTPREHRLEVPVSHALWNPYGKVFDRWGRGILLDASAGQYYPMDVISTPFVFPKAKQRTNHLSFAPGGAIAAGCEFVHSSHFPPQVQGRFLVNHCEGDVGVHWYDLESKGSLYGAKRHEPLATCSDRTFRPVAMAWGPDGALYIADFYSHIFENVNFSKRHPGRDHAHGRIWRISHKKRPSLKAPVIRGRPVAELLDLLKSAEGRTRELVRGELRARPPREVVAALEKWIGQLDSSGPDSDHHLVEGLWVFQGLGVVNSDLLLRLLNAKTPGARLAATQVLRHWQERITKPIALIRERANDRDAAVRLHAVLAAGFSRLPGALQAAREAGKHDMDKGLEYALGETVKYLTGREEHQAAMVAGLVGQVEAGKNRRVATAALRSVERAAWPTGRLDSLADSVLAYLDSVPESGRDSPVFLESFALARELELIIEVSRGEALAETLDGLGVSTFLIKTVPGRMLFDRTRLVVRPGRNISILFENNDLMPHNLLIIEPGAVQEVGAAADLMAARTDGLKRGYVPDSGRILQSTRLLRPGESGRLDFTVPARPGEYPFICTFPGHWRSMRGVIEVVAAE